MHRALGIDFSTRVVVWCVFIDQIGAGMRCRSDTCPSPFPPRRVPLWYFTVNLTPFLKRPQFCTDPRYCVAGGGSPRPRGAAGMSPRVFFLEFLPGESLQLCYCSKVVNKSFFFFSCLSLCRQRLCVSYTRPPLKAGLCTSPCPAPRTWNVPAGSGSFLTPFFL